MKDGWQKITLGAAFTTVTGNTPAKNNPKFYGSFIPFVKPPELLNDTVELAENGLSEYGAKVARVAPKNSILVSCIGNLGKVGLNTVPVAFNQQINAILLPAARVMPRFMFYQTLSCIFKSQLEELASGTTIKIVNKSKFNSIEVILPPLAEQKRIVAKLDEAFVGLAKAKENAEKNLQNARALFESHLESVFTQRGKGWVEKKLDDVCGFQNGFAFKSNTFKATGAPVIRISNIQDGRIDTENRLVFVNPKDYREDLERYRIVKNDLLIAMSGATTGKLGFNTENTVFYLNQRVGKFEPGAKLDKQFLYYFLSTRVEENLRISAGAAQPNLSTEQIKGFVIPLPPVEEQTRIVLKLESLSEQTQRLAFIYEQKLEALDSLKKSLLHEAFSGNL